MLLLTSATAFRVSKTKVMKLKELKPKFPTPPGQLCLCRTILYLKHLKTKLMLMDSKNGPLPLFFS